MPLRPGLSLPLGELEGVQARAHVSLVVVAVAFGLGAFGAPSPDDVDDVAVGAISVLVAVLVHELGHASVRALLGSRVGQIVLYPFGGVADGGERPPGPGYVAAVALGGPLASLAAATALRYLGAPEHQISLYVALGLGNLLPLVPFDGAAVLMATLSTRMREQAAARVTAIVGQVGAIVVFLAAIVVERPWLLLFAVLSFLFACSARARAGVARPENARESL